MHKLHKLHKTFCSKTPKTKRKIRPSDFHPIYTSTVWNNKTQAYIIIMRPTFMHSHSQLWINTHNKRLYYKIEVKRNTLTSLDNQFWCSLLLWRVHSEIVHEGISLSFDGISTFLVISCEIPSSLVFLKITQFQRENVKEKLCNLCNLCNFSKIVGLILDEEDIGLE